MISCCISTFYVKTGTKLEDLVKQQSFIRYKIGTFASKLCSYKSLSSDEPVIICQNGSFFAFFPFPLILYLIKVIRDFGRLKLFNQVDKVVQAIRDWLLVYKVAFLVQYWNIIGTLLEPYRYTFGTLSGTLLEHWWVWDTKLEHLIRAKARYEIGTFTLCLSQVQNWNILKP